MTKVFPLDRDGVAFCSGISITRDRLLRLILAVVSIVFSSMKSLQMPNLGPDPKRLDFVSHTSLLFAGGDNHLNASKGVDVFNLLSDFRIIFQHRERSWEENLGPVIDR